MGGPSGVLDLTSPSPMPPVAMPTAAPCILAVPRLNIPQVEMHMRQTPYERKVKSQAIKANQAYVAIPARKVNKCKRDASEEGKKRVSPKRNLTLLLLLLLMDGVVLAKKVSVLSHFFFFFFFFFLY